jgi:clan AA aspartic protease (TIGR02281 family)
MQNGAPVQPEAPMAPAAELSPSPDPARPTSPYNSGAFSVTLRQDGGTYVVSVLINGKIPLDFTVDSGAADVSIPADVFSTLRRTGTISSSDIFDSKTYELADGSTLRSQQFRIRTLKVGTLEMQNVIGSVTPAAGNLLLGQSFLSRVQSWSIDNQRHLLLINPLPQ